MKGLVFLLLLLETFVFVNGGLIENEISRQLSSEDRRENPPPTDTLRAEASNESQEYCCSDVYAALAELANTVAEQKENIRALETRLRDEMNQKNYEMYNFILSQVEDLKQENRESAIAFSVGQPGPGYVGPFGTAITLTYNTIFTNIGNAYNPITGVFTAPLKGAYMFRISVYGHGGVGATADIVKNGQLMALAHADQTQLAINSSNGIVLILEVGDVVYVRLQTGRRIIDNGNNHNTFTGFLLFPL